MKKQFVIILLFLILAGCKKYYNGYSGLETPDWTEETHGNSTDPNYSIVFNEGTVLRFDITISAEDWYNMQADLSANSGISSPPPPNWVPLTVACSFVFADREWYKVGIRYKGNSSLRSCVQRSIKKYSFKLDFDEYEATYPEIKNQRFYGFRQLSLVNGFDDMSLMREKTTSDLFRSFGIPSARTAFCQVWINYGQGSKYFGLYTLVEEVDDTVIDTQFQGGGNLYKPEGIAATFGLGTYNEQGFYKQNNTDLPDYTDVKALYDRIHSTDRIYNPSAWKVSVEEVFAVPEFIRWLAANTVVQNWDTYGKQKHNYYLYNNPVNGKLTWIPWDNNESLSPGKQGGALSLPLSEVSDGWPLIRFLMNDASYYAQYKDFTSSFVQDIFSVSSFTSLINAQADLIRPYALAEQPGYTFLTSSSAFDTGVNDLRLHVQNRNNAVSSFLAR